MFIYLDEYAHQFILKSNQNMYRFCIVETDREHISRYARLASLVFKKPYIFTHDYIEWEYVIDTHLAKVLLGN